MSVAFREMGTLIRKGNQEAKIKTLQAVIALLSVQVILETIVKVL